MLMVKKLLGLIIFIILTIAIYGYNSGSCKLEKEYICDKSFCLFKEFKIYLENKIGLEINSLISNKDIQKRVEITTYPETIFNCALPNKKGITISTNNIIKYAP